MRRLYEYKVIEVTKYSSITESYLNSIGNEGWRLKSTIQVSGNKYMLIFIKE